MNFILSSLLISMSFGVGAAPLPQELSTCRTQVQRAFKGTALGDWQKTLGADFETKGWKRSEGKIGEWTELQTNDERTVLYQIHSRKVERLTWTQPKCAKTQTTEQLFSVLPTGKEVFDDEALVKLVESQKKILVYTWSPRFVYSVSEMALFQKVAVKNGYQFVPLLDPEVSRAEAQAAYQKYQELSKDSGKLPRMSRLPDESLPSSDLFRPMASVDLYMRNGLNHYPTTYVIHHGKIHPQWIVGVMSESFLQALINEREK